MFTVDSEEAFGVQCDCLRAVAAEVCDYSKLAFGPRFPPVLLERMCQPSYLLPLLTRKLWIMDAQVCSRFDDQTAESRFWAIPGCLSLEQLCD
jgi:hypothetical protein